MLPKPDISEVADDVVNIRSTTLQTYDLLKGHKTRKLLRWLSASDPSKNLDTASKKRYAGTGSWLLENPFFMEWKVGSRKCLWLHGIPGCGKTVLCSTIIQEFCRSTDGSSLLLSFFFDFNDSSKQTLDNLLRSLAAQMFMLSPPSREALEALFSECSEGVTQPTVDRLSQVVLTMLKMLNKPFIIVDALDECTTRKELISWLAAVYTDEHDQMSLLITSRKERGIQIEISRWLRQDNYISLQQSSVDSDIGRYIRGTLHENNEFGRWHFQPHVLEEIEHELTRKAEGM